MNNNGKIFLNSIYAGLFIGIAGTVFLATQNPLLGPFLFALGLLVIICYGFKLFTGAVGYWADQSEKNIITYAKTLLLIWLGNLAGCFTVGALIRQSRVYPLFAGRLRLLCAIKLNDNPASLLILAFFCGILMYVAVETFRKTELPGFCRTVMVFLCVSVFILSGFEHSIAGMYYFAANGSWDWPALQCILLMTLGNALGGMLIPFGNKFRQ